MLKSPENDKYRVDWINEPESLWLDKLVGGCSTIGAQLFSRATDAYLANAKWPFSPDHMNQLARETEGHATITASEATWYLREGYDIVSSAFLSDGYFSKSPFPSMNGRNSKNKTYGHPRFTVHDGLNAAPAAQLWKVIKDRPNVKLETSATVDYI